MIDRNTPLNDELYARALLLVDVLSNAANSWSSGVLTHGDPPWREGPWFALARYLAHQEEVFFSAQIGEVIIRIWRIDNPEVRCGQKRPCLIRFDRDGKMVTLLGDVENPETPCQISRIEASASEAEALIHDTVRNWDFIGLKPDSTVSLDIFRIPLRPVAASSPIL